jgi:hypothetical protein
MTFVAQTRIDESQAPILPDLPNVSYHLIGLTITPDEVQLVMKSLPLGKAAGPGDINNRILRELSHELSGPQSSLFNYSIWVSQVRDVWKEANVSPLFKSGDPSLVNNYRPIPLISTVNKVFERIVFKHTLNFLRDTNIIASLQSGFVPRHSTVNQLTYLYIISLHRSLILAVFCDIS